MPSSREKKRQKSNDGIPVVLPVGSPAVVLPDDDDKTKQEEVDAIICNVIWKSSDAAVVRDGLAKLAYFCLDDSDEAKAYRLILCQDRRLSVATSAMIEWAENPVVISVACAVITNALASKEVDYETVETTGLVVSVLKAMRKHPNS